MHIYGGTYKNGYFITILSLYRRSITIKNLLFYGEKPQFLKTYYLRRRPKIRNVRFTVYRWEGGGKIVFLVYGLVGEGGSIGNR